MDFLDRKQYNQKIEELNAASNIQDSTMKELTTLYDNLFCNSSDYEEIVMLINICIAEDRKNNLEKLYEIYSKLKKTLNDHGDYAIEDYYMILYCMGVFSFKFHDYKEAIEYFKKCEKQIENKFDDPYNSKQGDIYVKVKILMSYSLEYDGYLNEGPKSAIDNILDRPLVTTEGIEEQIINEIEKEPKEIVSNFFKRYPSKTYSFASESMKKEILHVLAHCFSEYANRLKVKQCSYANYKAIYLWEKIAGIFIDTLGAEMTTCKAIILSEHGQYWTALDSMKRQYESLSEDEKKKKAELAFYIYYFSNQIGTDQGKEIEEYKRDFLNFANQENGDTEVYAWIVEFREKLGKALEPKNKNKIQSLLELESFIKKAKGQNTNQSYLHPQILREKNRLLLAYQILRSYLIINEKGLDAAIDNSLFEKCVLFSKQSNTDQIFKKEKISWEEQDYLLKLHNICLCVSGMTEEMHCKLEKEFCIDIPYFNNPSFHEHKIIICDEENKLSALGEMEKSNLILFIYCPEKYYSRIKDMVDENVCVETDLVKTFKMAYIQEILEQCYQFAYKWDEFFVMAPITDNSTFAFQSQGIEYFLKIKDSEQDEKKLFSEDNGYVTNEFQVLTKGQKIYHEFAIKEENENARIFYFSRDCLYIYQREQSYFIPYKVLSDLDSIKKTAYKLRKNKKRQNVIKRKCDCQLKTSNCFCDEWEANKPEVYELLMKFSVKLPLKEEEYCTIVWSGNMNEGNNLENFLLIMSKRKIRSFSLREQLNELSNLSEKPDSAQNNLLDKKKDNETKELQKLLDRIIEYMNKHSNDWPKSSYDYQQAHSLRKNIETAIQEGNIKEYEEFCSEWVKLSNGIAL